METRFEWQYKSANPLAAAEYKDFNVSELLAQVLVNRGVSAREYSKISYHFNDLRTEYLESIVDLEKACEYFIERTDKLRNRNKKIYIFADYDADGITSAAIANITLKKLGFTPVIHVPERSEGYGLSRKWSEELSRASQKSQNKERPLVVTFDNGITKADEVELLKESGIDVIVGACASLLRTVTPRRFRFGTILASGVIRFPTGAWANKSLCSAIVSFR